MGVKKKYNNGKYKNKYRISSSRIKGYDYGSNGHYFITICTQNRVHYFGKIESSNDAAETHHCASDVETHHCASLRPTPIGEIAIKYWKEIPEHYPFIELKEFVVMPNHIHGILYFNKPVETPWQPNTFGRQSENLGAVIRAFKSTVKRFANQNAIEFNWQARFHESIICNEKQLNAVSRYIINNPAKWMKKIQDKEAQLRAFTKHFENY